MLELKIDKEQLERQLGEFKAKAPNLLRRIIGKLFSLSKKEVQKTKLKGQILDKRTGNLAKMITWKTRPNGSGFIRSGAFYSSFFERGPTHIVAKGNGFLTFNNGENWVKTKEVTLPRKEFFEPVVTDNFESTKGKDQAEGLAQDELNKYFNKDK